MEVRLALGDRAGIHNVLSSIEKPNIDTAMQMRAIRRTLGLWELGDMTVKQLNEDAQQRPPTVYILEKGRVEWLRIKIKEAFDAGRVHATMTDFVLGAYEAVEDAEKQEKAAHSLEDPLNH